MKLKLKNMLILTFLILTLFPVIIVTLLLYNSGYNLSKESYRRNMVESINVQANYITQTISNNMIVDSRFASRITEITNKDDSRQKINENMYAEFQNYLKTLEDRISICMLLDVNNNSIYSIGEKSSMDLITSQLPNLNELDQQLVTEFNLGDNSYSIGIVTPMKDENSNYVGSLVSVYGKSQILKTISSYYEIADTYTYICRGNGEITNSKDIPPGHAEALSMALNNESAGTDGSIDTTINGDNVLGSYKKIHNTPWYLTGVMNNDQIHTFLNQFIWVYQLVIVLVFIADIILAIAFSNKVVKPINSLIYVIEGYPGSLKNQVAKKEGKTGYYEIEYFKTKFLNLMNTIMLVQHNYEGIYKLYQSNTMDDTNIDIDTINQTIQSNKDSFTKLIDEVVVPEDACIVDKFVNCFCEKDKIILMNMLEKMRDNHLSIAQEAEVFTPYMGEKWYHILVVPMYQNDRLSRVFAQLRDISAFKKQELESMEQAKHEPLTGLFNRSGFSSCVERIISNSNKNSVHGLLFIDMNDFKQVNDSLGHSAGDDLLRQVSKDLVKVSGPDSIASRFGGDEFAVFVPNTSKDAVNTLKSTLVERLVYPYKTSETSFVVSTSVGISIWRGDNPLTIEEMLNESDVSMYNAKRDFKRRSTDK